MQEVSLDEESVLEGGVVDGSVEYALGVGRQVYLHGVLCLLGAQSEYINNSTY